MRDARQELPAPDFTLFAGTTLSLPEQDNTIHTTIPVSNNISISTLKK
ncbi:MAG: hypothetical protein IJS13_07605 [Paludibacteraceae bacterium]|nr:hypothetical protein [Paludibacteraceae bacterium]